MKKINVFFAQPFSVSADLAEKISGRVVILDLGFNNGAPNSADRDADYRATTGAFIQALGGRLVRYIDHHPHVRWADFAEDERFILKSREEAPACPVIINTNIVEEVNTIVAHGDFDGIISAAKYALGGCEPYPGADADAIAADTRKGELSERGRRFEEATKADLRDDSIRVAIFTELVTGEPQPAIDEARKRYAAIQAKTVELTEKYRHYSSNVLVCRSGAHQSEFDLTALLLAGQKGGNVAMVTYLSSKGEDLLTVAGDREWDFVKLLNLPGGMPNRVTVSSSRLEEVMSKVIDRSTAGPMCGEKACSGEACGEWEACPTGWFVVRHYNPYPQEEAKV